jgi:UDP-3-O-[3-hydroxymyristoyl] glucosamine N-acyltransferase
MKSYTVQEINEVLNGVLLGTTSKMITAPEQLGVMSDSDITFIGNKKYEKLWSSSKACVAVVNEDISIEPGDNRALLKSKCRFSHVSGFRTFAPPSLSFMLTSTQLQLLINQLRLNWGKNRCRKLCRAKRENWRKCNPIS